MEGDADCDREDISPTLDNPPALDPQLYRNRAVVDLFKLTGNARDDERALLSGMDDVVRHIRHHAFYCIQPLSISADQSYAPPLKDVACLQRPSDIVVLIDESSVASRTLYRDLLLGAKLPEEVAFWDARAEAPSSLFQQTSCEERMKLDISSWTFSTATVYLRVMDSGVSYRSCIRALPYLIFGQLPVQRSNGRQDLIPELLELRYSPDLAPGMNQGEIEGRFAE